MIDGSGKQQNKRRSDVNEYSAVIKTLKNMGYKTTAPRSKNANGPDLFAIKTDRVLSVEIKSAKAASKTSNVLRVPPVKKNRINDDLIAIVLPSGYVLVEPMRDHIASCNNSGYRFLNF